MMLSHHIVVAIRNIRKQGVYALLNFAGLGIGLVLSLFVLLLLNHELNYDTSFSDNDRIARVVTKGVLGTNLINTATTPMPLKNMLDDIDEVENSLHFVPGANNLVEYNDKGFNENNFKFSDANFFEIFDVNFVTDQPEDLLSKAREVVITQSMAQKYFGDEDPVGEKILRDAIEYTVTAVCKDFPSTTHFDFGFLASISTIEEILLRKKDTAYVKYWKEDWLFLNCYTYLKTDSGISFNDLEEEINLKKDQLMTPQIEGVMAMKESSDTISLKLKLQPIKEIHLLSHMDSELESNSKPIYIGLFAFIALFVMFTTCINFINLTTAKIRVKYKEVGYRQLLGARRGQLIGQFLVEAIVYSVGAMFLAMVLLEITLPFLNATFNVDLQFNFFKGWVEFADVLLMLLVISFLAGSFPAFFFSGKRPQRLIAGDLKLSGTSLVVRGLMVASQVGVAMFLAVVATAMWWQVDFVKDNDPGFKTDHIRIVERGYAVRDNYDSFKREIKSIPGVKQVAACRSLPGDEYYELSVRMPNGGKGQVKMVPVVYVSEEYFELMGLKLKSGRFLSGGLGDSLGIVLNKSAVEELKLRKPLGTDIKVIGKGDWSLNTVGIVKDFHFDSYFSEIQPLGMLLLNENMRFEYVMIEMEEGYSSESWTQVNKVWSKYTDGAPFVWQYFKERLDMLYKEDSRITRIISVFAVLSILMALLGVIALVTFIMEYHSRTINIKKALGVPRQTIILQLFSKFGVYILAGILLAIFPAYLAIMAWGESYAYFDYAGAVSFIIWALILIALSFMVVFYLVYKAASISPLHVWRHD